MGEIQYYNSQEAAKILGVNVSTIKRWTDDGKLECIRTPGGHRKFVMKHLSKFLEKNRKKTTKVNLFPLENETDLRLSNHILKGSFSHLVDYIERQALGCNRQRVQKVLNGLYLAQYPLHVIYDNILTPILQRIGRQWMDGKIGVIEEHLASQTLRDSILRLQGIIDLPPGRQGRAMCMNLSGELHDIALKMVHHVLEVRGYKVLFSGQNTPIFDFVQFVESYRPDRLYVSSSFIDNLEKSQKEFSAICDICVRYDTHVYVGGGGFDHIKFDHPSVIKRLFTFEDVHRI